MTKPHAKQIREAARLITEAKRPVLYVGGGVLKARAAAELRVLAELTGIPVVTTLMARGAFPDSHPQHLGMPGMHGTVAAVTALQKADLIIALGARFDDRVTGKLDTFAPDAKIIHADIDPAEICKNRARRRADRRRLPRGHRRPGRRRCRPSTTHGQHARLRRLVEPAEPWQRRPTRSATTSQADGSLAPQYVIERLGQLAGPDAIYVAGRRPAPDVGRAVHRLREPRHLAQLRRRSARWATRCPAAMGAKVGPPGRAPSGRSTATAASR